MDLGAVLGVVGVVLALAGILIAFFVPIQMERLRRPVLSIEPDEFEVGEINGRRARFAKIAVRNVPLRPEDSPWYFPKAHEWLMRATATGCKVTVEFFEDLGTGARPRTNVQMRWDATPEPMNFYVDATGALAAHPDMTKVPQSLSLDVPPNAAETIAVGIKFEGDSEMYAFGAWSYFTGGPDLFTDPRWALPADEYRLSVRANAGGITVRRTLRVRNYGTGLRDFGVVDD